ncbi:MAG: hypothetical protein C5B54_12180 [Acidobacteria bacterium]|nr:MAG: hypothetical protein C5B54_12180 [Acidobacteriota bacterium]
MKSRPFVVLMLFGILLEATFLILLAVYNWTTNIPVFLYLFFFSFLNFLIITWLALRKYFDAIPNLTILILAGAVLFRITVFWCPPTLSEDIYRYIHDGKAQIAGFSPYDYPPGAPELKSIRDENWEKINWKQFKTPYPPGAEDIFHLLTRISFGVNSFKFGILCFDFLLLECLRRLLIKEGRSPALLLIYAWHPLPIIEFSSSGHMDILGISLLVFSLLWIAYQQNVAAGITLATAAMTKYLPLFAVPWMIPKGRWKFLLAATITAGLFALQFYTPDLRMLDGIHQYYSKWWFNDSMFSLLRHAFSSAEWARRTGILCTVALTLYCMYARFPVYRSLLLIFGMVLVFSPVVHPWYVCWVIPFLVFHMNRAWLFFSGWICISYLIRYLFPVGVWNEPDWLKLLVYVPFYALLIFDFFTAKFSTKAG